MTERFSLSLTADTLFDANINKNGKKKQSSLFPPDVDVDPAQNVCAFQLAAIKRRI